MSLRGRDSQGRLARSEEDMVAVYVSRDEIRDLDATELGSRIATAAGMQARETSSIAEFAPAPLYTIQDVLLGNITWEELTRMSG
ncbi:hypothetical protein ABTX61_39680 [Amycolatopsis japonica]|uniref:hypothetical protein n=1 Tax=Amycolatopsis japonica TaxID=208439 RepID=UPI0033230A7D